MSQTLQTSLLQVFNLQNVATFLYFFTRNSIFFSLVGKNKPIFFPLHRQNFLVFFSLTKEKMKDKTGKNKVKHKFGQNNDKKSTEKYIYLLDKCSLLLNKGKIYFVYLLAIDVF